MDLFKLIKWILQYLPWPVTVVITILIFKKYINVFLEKLTKLKIGDFEFTAKEYSGIKTPAIENNELEVKSGATPAENQIQKVEGKGEAIETTGRYNVPINLDNQYRWISDEQEYCNHPKIIVK